MRGCRKPLAGFLLAAFVGLMAYVSDQGDPLYADGVAPVHSGVR